MGVCTDGGVTIFRSRSEFMTKIKEKTPNAVESTFGGTEFEDCVK